MTDEEMARKCAADLEDPKHRQLYVTGFLDCATWKQKDATTGSSEEESKTIMISLSAIMAALQAIVEKMARK
jgi:hypothetical protein